MGDFGENSLTTLIQEITKEAAVEDSVAIPREIPGRFFENF